MSLWAFAVALASFRPSLSSPAPWEAQLLRARQLSHVCSENQTYGPDGCPYAHTPSYKLYKSRFATLMSRSCSTLSRGRSSLGGAPIVAHAMGRLTGHQLRAGAFRRASQRSREGSSSAEKLERWLQVVEKKMPRPQAVCEIGLNTGLSAIAWLCAFPQAHYIGFDLLRHNITRTTADFLRREFPGRVEIHAGSSVEMVLKLPTLSCDVVSIDGGHYKDVPWHDLRNMRRVSRQPNVVIMDDLRCFWGWCKDPTAWWDLSIASGMLVQHGCELPPGTNGCCDGFCWGSFSARGPAARAARTHARPSHPRRHRRSRA